jgi:hypothetical protein
MPTEEELAFIKAIPPMIVEDMKKTLAAGGIGHARPAEKRKATELAFSADSSEPATRRPAAGAGPTPLEQHSSDSTGKQVAYGDRQLESPEGGMTLGCGCRACRTAKAKWAAQANSQLFGLVRTCCLREDNHQTHV